MLQIPLLSTPRFNMEQIRLGYSLKNIPIPGKKEYGMEIISSAEKLVSNMKKRAWHYLNPNNNSHKETYGFRSTKPAPAVPELKEFEAGLIDLVKKAGSEFKPPHLIHNEFQAKLKKDIKDIKKDDRLLIAADKTTNHYKVDTKTYENLLTKNIQ